MPSIAIGNRIGRNSFSWSSWWKKLFETLYDEANTLSLYEPAGAENILKRESEDIAWYDLKGGKIFGSELSSGSTASYGIYKITATAVDYFYAGCQIGDIFVSTNAKALSGTNKVQQMAGHHMCQGNTGYAPIDGVFDGVDDYSRTQAFVLNQPFTIHIIGRLKSGRAGGYLFDGTVKNYTYVKQINTTRNIRQVAGIDSLIDNSVYWNNIYSVLSVVYNGENSFIKVNDFVKVANSGTNNAGGLTFGSRGDGSAVLCSNLEVRAAIVRGKAESIEDCDTVMFYYRNKYNLDLRRTYFDEGYCIFSFDGNIPTHYSIMWPETKARGIKATNYIDSGAVDWDIANQMYNDGIDIQDHANDNFELVGKSEEYVINWLTAIDADFVAHGLPAPRHLAYPGGNYDTTLAGYVSQKRDTARKINAVSASIVSIQNYWIRYWIDAGRLDNVTAANIQDYKDKLLEAKTNKTCAFFYGHYIVQETGLGYITEELFLELLNYVVEIGLKSLTITEYYDKINAMKYLGSH